MNKLIERPNITQNLKSTRLYKQLGELLIVLEKKELTNEIVELINQEIEHLNSISETDKRFMKIVKDTESKIIKFVEKRLKIVPKNYYTKHWLVLGMIVFGPPLGVVIGSIIGNVGLFIGIGIPIGLALGIIIGSGMDKKALNEGRQLDFEVKY